jgi:hypothetical protein
MKTLLLSLTLLSSTALSANLEPNAYIYMYNSDSETLNACILYEDHYYYAPRIEHYMKCPACMSD